MKDKEIEYINSDNLAEDLKRKDKEPITVIVNNIMVTQEKDESCEKPKEKKKSKIILIIILIIFALFMIKKHFFITTLIIITCLCIKFSKAIFSLIHSVIMLIVKLLL